MSAISALGFTAFLLCLVMTPLCRDLFLRFNIVDHPDAVRKLHLRPIPRIGGIPIVLSYGGAIALMFLLAPHGARIYVQHEKLLLSLLPAAGLIFVVGLIDDIVGLQPWQKLIGQFAGALLAVSLGARVSTLHGLPASLWITVPFSLIWLIGCTNAVNLIDGLDGLASGVGLFATLATLIAALISGNMGLAMATIPLAGCLLAFLRFNFSPASIFLGDCGSLTIGFMLGCFGLIWSQLKRNSVWNGVTTDGSGASLVGCGPFNMPAHSTQRSHLQGRSRTYSSHGPRPRIQASNLGAPLVWILCACLFSRYPPDLHRPQIFVAQHYSCLWRIDLGRAVTSATICRTSGTQKVIQPQASPRYIKGRDLFARTRPFSGQGIQHR